MLFFPCNSKRSSRSLLIVMSFHEFSQVSASMGSRILAATFRHGMALFCLGLFAAGMCRGALALTINVPKDQPTIQAGINAANNGDTVLVAPGTYRENIDFRGKAITVISSGGPATTTIQGDGTTAVVAFHTNESRTSVISGFTITGGGATNLSAGGGVEATNSAPTILNNIITANQCHAVWVEFGAALIEGNTLSGTTPSSGSYCSFNGSGILLIGSVAPAPGHSEVIGNKIINNLHAIGYDGGGILLWDAEGSVIENNIIAGNATTGQGGALTSYNTDAMIIAQNLVVDNTAAYGAGGISILAPSGTQGPFIGLIQNNTFAANTVTNPTQQGSASASQVYLEGNLGQYEFTDNILVGADSLPAFMCGTTYNYLSITPLVIDHDDIYNSAGPAYGGACPDQTGQYGNISANPLFKNAPGNDYHLLAGSPAIDAGNNSALQLLANLNYSLAGDLDGSPRVQDATGKGYPIIDMGAYEYSGATTASSTTAVLNPSSYNVAGGQSLTLTANLYSALGTPTGTVTFFEDGNQVGTAAVNGTGAATLTLGSGLVPGTHAFLAVYPGQGSFTPCKSVKIYVIVTAYGVTLTLTAAPNPSFLGQNVIFEINISSANGVPPGNVTLTDNSTNSTLATLTPDAKGNASFSISTLAAGTHLIEAFYPGNATYQNASSYVDQQVINGYTTSTSLASSLNPATVGQSVTFTATVASSNGVPTGSVVFTDGATTLGNVNLAGGSASLSTSSLSVGSHNITATYSPTGTFAGSSGSLTEVINGAATTTTLTSTVNPAYALQPVTLNAAVKSSATGTPAGSVTFMDGAATLGSAPLAANGTASLSLNFAAPGSHLLTAIYSGDANFNGSTSSVLTESIQINTTTTTLQGPAGAQAFVGVAFTVTVMSSTAAQFAPGTVPAGTVTCYDGAAILGTATLNAAGAANCPNNSFSAGAHSLTAVYNGNTSFQSSTSAPSTIVIAKDATTTTIAGAPNPAALGTAVTFSLTVASAITTVAPSGTVTIYDGTNVIGQAALSAQGQATYTTSTLAVGTHSISALYNGDSSFITSASSAIEETISPFIGDFTFSTTPSSMTFYTGQAGTANAIAVAQGGFNYALALSCSGLPAEATCKFQPATIADGNGTATLTIQTSAPAAVAGLAPKNINGWRRSGGAAVLACVVLLFLPSRRRPWLWMALFAALAATTVTACGGPGTLTGGTPPATYTVTVSAQATNSGQLLTHSTTITLTVKSLF